MKLIHSSGYSDAEKKWFKEVIFSNIIQSMKSILEAMQTLGIGLGNHNTYRINITKWNLILYSHYTLYFYF